MVEVGEADVDMKDFTAFRRVNQEIVTRTLLGTGFAGFDGDGERASALGSDVESEPFGTGDFGGIHAT